MVDNLNSKNVRDRPPTPVPSDEPDGTLRPSSLRDRTSDELRTYLDRGLRPDPGLGNDFQRPNSKFAFSIGSLNRLFNPKSHEAFVALGGLQGLEKGLRTDRNDGLDIDECQVDGEVSFELATDHIVADFGSPSHQWGDVDSSYRPSKYYMGSSESFQSRKQHFGDGRLPIRSTKMPWKFAWDLHKLELLILGCTSLSMILRLYQDLVLKPAGSQLKNLWGRDATVLVLVSLVVLTVSSFCSYDSRAQHLYLGSLRRSHVATVVRSGRLHEVLWDDVLVGDVVYVQTGDLILADGIVVHSRSLRCDESQATGESDILLKDDADTAYAALKTLAYDPGKLDPFVVSGATVHSGTGTYLVTSAGVNSSFGKMMMSLMDETYRPHTHLSARWIQDVCNTFAAILFLILMVKFFVDVKKQPTTSFDTGLRFLQVLQLCLLILMLGVSHWAPLAIELLQSWCARNTSSRVTIRHALDLDTLSKVSTICVDLNALLDRDISEVTEVLTVDLSCTGFRTLFSASMINHSSIKEQSVQASSSKEISRYAMDNIKQLWKESLLATCYGREVRSKGMDVIKGGDSCQSALLKLGRDLLGCDFTVAMQRNLLRTDLIEHDDMPNSWRQTVAFATDAHGTQKAYFVGEALSLLQACRKVIGCSPGGANSIRHPNNGEIAEKLRDQLLQYASQGLLSLGFAFCDAPKDGFPDRRAIDDRYFDRFRGSLTFIGFVNVKMKLKEGAKKTLTMCQDGGILMRLMTGWDSHVAEHFAKEAGVSFPQGMAMSAREFGRLTDAQRRVTIPRTYVFALEYTTQRTIVKNLLDSRDNVMIVGATVGYPRSWSVLTLDNEPSRTSWLRDRSHIVCKDNSFDVLPELILAGRAFEMNHNKSSLFALVWTVTLFLLILASAVADSWSRSVITPPQLVLIYILFAMIGVVVLILDPPNTGLWSEKPVPSGRSFFNLSTQKVLFIQLSYQLAVMFVMTFGSRNLFHHDTEEHKSALVLSTFMWMQLFNLVGALRLPHLRQLSAYRGRAICAVTCLVLIILAIVLISLFGGQAFGVRRLYGYEWAISIGPGLLSPVVRMVAKRVPDTAVTWLIPNVLLLKYCQPRTAAPSGHDLLVYYDARGPPKSVYTRLFRKLRTILTAWYDKRRSPNEGDISTISRDNEENADIEMTT